MPTSAFRSSRSSCDSSASGTPRDVGLLDDVARVDVVVAIGFLLAADDEEHARVAAGIHDGAHGCDVTRPLGLDTRGEFVELFLFEGRAGKIANRLTQSGAQAIDVEAGHLRGRDDGAFGHRGFLIGRRLRGSGQQGDEESKCTHASGKSKE